MGDDTYQELVELFPAASRTWLRAHARHGVELISNHLLDHPNAVPHTRGADTDDEQERRAHAQAQAVQPAISSDDEVEEDMDRVRRLPQFPPLSPILGPRGEGRAMRAVMMMSSSDEEDGLQPVQQPHQLQQQPHQVRGRGRGRVAVAVSSSDEEEGLQPAQQQQQPVRAAGRRRGRAAAAEDEDAGIDDDNDEPAVPVAGRVRFGRHRVGGGVLRDRGVQQQQPRGDAAVDGQQGNAVAPPRKQQRMQPQPIGEAEENDAPAPPKPLKARIREQQKAARAAAGQQQQPRAARAAAAAAAAMEEEEEEPFRMRPIEPGEKCSADCKAKPKVARIVCQGNGKRQHTLCIGCLEARHARNLVLPSGPAHYTCPMRQCYNRIASRELHAVAAQYAPGFHYKLQPVQQQLLRRVISDSEDEEEPKEPSTPLASQENSLLDAGTPRVARRLSQVMTPISWTPPVSQLRRKARLDSIDEDEQVVPAVEEEEEEEEEASDEQEAELKAHAAFVDREKLLKLEKYFPETAVGWLVRHADYGMDALIEMVSGGQADVKKRPRADGRGATSIVEATLGARKQFECSVCFGDYDEHLAISCVWLERRRRTMMPGEAAPDAQQLAKDSETERKGRRDRHMFCAECVSGHARAAVEQNVIMEAGVGIRCMEGDCKNAILRAHLDQVLDMKTRAILDPLFTNEALLAANCEDIEKCQRCPFAAVMLDTKEVQPVFVCANPVCKHAHCRKCGRTWDNAHKNRTCEELDPEAVRKRVEEQLTEAAMFKCPRCKKGIVKADGCNKIACPCGQLSCYVCKAAIKDYKHFKNGPAEEHLDKCPLWKDPTAAIEEKRKVLLNEQIKGATDEATRQQLRGLH